MRPEQATAMRRFRSSSKWGSCLALFALALQLVLTFGHVHFDRRVPLSAEKFTAIAGIDRMPENWRAFLSGSSAES